MPILCTDTARSARDAVQMGGVPSLPHAFHPDLPHRLHMPHSVPCHLEISRYKVSTEHVVELAIINITELTIEHYTEMEFICFNVSRAHITFCNYVTFVVCWHNGLLQYIFVESALVILLPSLRFSSVSWELSVLRSSCYVLCV